VEPSDGIILSEVMARVAFRLVVQDYRAHARNYKEPLAGMLLLAARLDIAGFRALAVWVYTAAYSVRRQECSLAVWRDSVIRRARLHDAYRRQGRPWKRAANPPVSNTGVSSAVAVVRRPWGARKARWPNDAIK
jgi:hypothetical protein